MAGKMLNLPLPTDNPVGSTPTMEGTPGHAEDHDRIREILAILVNGYVPAFLGDLGDVNVDNIADGVGAGFVLSWDGNKWTPINLPTPYVGSLVSGATLRLQRPDGTFDDVLLPVNTGPEGVAGPPGRGISMLTSADNGPTRHLYVTFTDDPNNPVDLGALPSGAPGVNGSNGVDGVSATSFAVNDAGRLIVTLSNGQVIDAGNVVGPAGVGSFADSFRGEWSASTTYAKNDIVSYGGDSYFSRISSNLNHAPVDNMTSTEWALLALDGAKGDPGAQGPIGNTPALYLGPVTTGDPGTAASASLTGTPAAPQLNLTIPRGSMGLQGLRGEDGQPGAPGTAGAAGRSVSSLALSPTNVLTVTYSDGTSATVGTIATVKGDTGTAGTNGTNGTNGKDGVNGAAGRGIVSLTLANNVLSAVFTDSPNAVTVGTVTAPQQFRGLWAASTAYAVGDVLSYLGLLYQVKTAYTSGSTFDATNLTQLTTATQQVRGPFAPTTVYSAGDVVAYLGILYQAKAGFTSGSTFDVANWTGLTTVQGLFRGVWNPATTYVTGDVVVYQNVLWQATATSSGTFTQPLTSNLTGFTRVPGGAGTAGFNANGVYLNGVDAWFVTGPATVTSPAGASTQVGHHRIYNSANYQFLGAPPTAITAGIATPASGLSSIVAAFSPDGQSVSVYRYTGTTQTVLASAVGLANGQSSANQGSPLVISVSASNVVTVTWQPTNGPAQVVYTGSPLSGLSFGTGGIAAGFGSINSDIWNPMRNFQVTGTGAGIFPAASFTQATTAANSVKGVWSGTTAYTAGDVVSYLGNLYQATTDVAANATFQTASFLKLTTALPGTAPARAGLVLASASTTPGDVLYAPAAAAVAGAWTAIPLASGITATAGTIPQYRVVGDRVELRGYFRNVNGATQALTTMGTLPSGVAPTAETVYLGFFGNTVGLAPINIKPTGEVQLYPASTASGAVIGVYGISYSITADNAQPAYSSTFLTTLPTTWATMAHNNATVFTNNPAQYRVNGDVVEFRGYFSQVSAAANAGVVVATLPLGSRPPIAVPMLGLNTANGGSVQVLVQPDGTVTVFSAVALSGALIGVGGLNFSVSTTSPGPTGVVGSAWTALPLQSGVTATVSGNPPQYRIVGDTVQLRGYFTAVSGPAGTFAVMGTLPVGFRPPVNAPVVGQNASVPRGEPIVVSTDGTVNVFPTAALSGATIGVAGINFSVTT